MKAIVVRQPWAQLIALGVKTIETRPSPPNGEMRPDGVRGLPGLSLARGERVAIVAGRGPVDQVTLPGGLWVGSWCVEPVHLDEDLCVCPDPEGGVWSEGCRRVNTWLPALLRDEHGHGWSLASYLPSGAVVATAVVADACAIVDVGLGWWYDADTPDRLLELGFSPGELTLLDVCADDVDVSDQVPFGDFSPGRWGWLLEDLHRLPVPVPCVGRQGVFHLPVEVGL